MPVVLRDKDTLSRLRDARASASFFHTHIDRLRKDREHPFVVLCNNQIVARGKTSDAARTKAAAAGAVVRDCVVVRVPAEDETYFF